MNKRLGSNPLGISYARAACEIDADENGPFGEPFQNLLAAGIETVHRDTHHASLGLGRHALGLLWYRVHAGITSMLIMK